MVLASRFVVHGVVVAGAGVYYIVQSQLQSHFESIQKISDSTTLPSVLPHLKERLFELVDLSSLTEKLMAAKAGPGPQALSAREKMQIWQDLKVLSFSRTVCAMWSVCLLDLFVRTQLNILGRHVYIDTARDTSNSADPDASQDGHMSLSMSCQHKFIAFADYLPHRGLDALISDAREVVESVIQGKALKDIYKLEDLRALFGSIREAFEGRAVSWIAYVLPADDVLPDDLAAASSAADAARGPGGDESATAESDAAMLEELMRETRSVLSSKEFVDVLAASLEAVTDGVIEELGDTYGKGPHAGIPLAKLLPPVASVGSSLLEQPQSNRYIDILAGLPQVESFCALVYTSMGPPSR
eukprot:jgi/Mesen1/1445/ME000132S00389